jgi:hypothetical protein
LTSRSLATASNSEDSSASRAQVLLSQRPCRTLVNWQFNYGAIPSQLPLQSSTELNCPSCLLYNSSARTTLNTPFAYYWARVRFRGNVFTEPLFRNGRLFIRLLHSNDCTRCLFPSLCLATSLYATVYTHNRVISTHTPTEPICVFQPVPLFQRLSLTQNVTVTEHRLINRKAQFQDHSICC